MIFKHVNKELHMIVAQKDGEDLVIRFQVNPYDIDEAWSAETVANRIRGEIEKLSTPKRTPRVLREILEESVNKYAYGEIKYPELWRNGILIIFDELAARYEEGPKPAAKPNKKRTRKKK